VSSPDFVDRRDEEAKLYRLRGRMRRAGLGAAHEGGNRDYSGSLNSRDKATIRSLDEGLPQDAARDKAVTVVVKVLYNNTLHRRSVPLKYTLSATKGMTKR